MGYRLLLSGLLLTSVLYTLAARRIPMDPWTAEELINAQTLPTFYGALLALVLLFLLLRGRVPVSGGAGMRLIRGAGVGLLVIGFVLAIGWLDLWVSLGALLLASSLWLGERRWLPMLALAVGVPLLGFVGIELGLGVYLPD